MVSGVSAYVFNGHFLSHLEEETLSSSLDLQAGSDTSSLLFILKALELVKV